MVTSWDRPKSANRSIFLNKQRTLFLNFYHVLSAKKPERIRIRLGNHIFPNWKQKIHFSKKKSFFFQKSLKVPEKELSAGKTIFSQPEIRYEIGTVNFDQMKVSEKGTEPKSFN